MVSEINVPAILSKQLLHSGFFYVYIFLVYIPAKSHLMSPSLGYEIENTKGCTFIVEFPRAAL